MFNVFHTSPEPITEIDTDGRYGTFLFFAATEYVMTARAYITYALDIDDLDLIEAGQIFYQDNAAEVDHIVQQVMDQFDVDEDTAEDLIDESQNIIKMPLDAHNVEPEDLSDATWDMQYYTALAAKTLGFDGVEVSDEQGVSYMIDMTDRIGDLVEQ